MEKTQYLQIAIGTEKQSWLTDRFEASELQKVKARIAEIRKEDNGRYTEYWKTVPLTIQLVTNTVQDVTTL